MPTRQQLESALINADKAGDVQAATELANALKANQFEGEDFTGSGIIEPIAAIGSSIAGSVAGGLAGLGVGGVVSGLNAVNVGEDVNASEASSQVSQQVQKDFTYQPKTEAGKQGMKTIGEFAKMLNIPMAGLAGIVEGITGGSLDEVVATIDRVKEKGVGGEFGSAVLEATDNPALATIADLGSQGLADFATGGAIFGAGKKVLGGAKKGVDIAGPQLKQLGQQGKELAATVSNIKTPGRKEIARQLKTGEINTDTARFKLAQEGITDPNKVQKALGLDLPKVVKDKPFIKAEDQGFNPNFLEVVRKSATPADKASLSKMTRIAEKGRINPVFARDNRPSYVAGDLLLDKVNEIKSINKIAGKQIGATKKALAGKQIDASNIGDNLLESFKELKIKVDGDSLDFSEALVSGAGRKRAITDIYGRMRKNANPDALDLHELKGFLDEVISYGKDIRGLGGNAERVLTKLRKDIKTKLDDNFPEYAQANKAYSDTIGILDEVQRLAGKHTDLTSDSAGGQLASLARRITSEAQSKSAVTEAFKMLDEVLNTHGGIGGAKRIKGSGGDSADFNLLMDYATEIDRVTGSKAKTSITGVGESAIKAASGQKGIKEQLADFAVEKLKGREGVTEKNAYKSMIEFLNAQTKGTK